MSNQILPFEPAMTTKRAFGSVRVAERVALNFFQDAPMPLIFSGLLHAAPSAVSKTAIRGPLNPSAHLAQNDKLYFSPSDRPIPQKPWLEIPKRPAASSSTSSRSDLGVAAFNGSVMSSCIDPCDPPSLIKE